jgi:HAD superfamily hydrolase (TIGR01509 family)
MKAILVDAAKTFVVNGKIDEEMHDLLESYKNPKIILTNASDEQLVEFGVVDMPYEVFTLKHNPNKVDPKYFITLLDKYKFDVSDVVYFEHNQEAVDTAKSLGIVSYFYASSNRDLLALKEFLESNLD